MNYAIGQSACPLYHRIARHNRREWALVLYPGVTNLHQIPTKSRTDSTQQQVRSPSASAVAHRPPSLIPYYQTRPVVNYAIGSQDG